LRLIVWGGLAFVVLYYSGNLAWFLETEKPSPSIVEDIGPSVLSEPAWPQYRGPTHDGISAEIDLADTWPPEGPPILWKREIGRGYSGLISVGHRVYTQRQTPLEQSVVSLDADTGALAWEHRYGWAYEPAGMYPGPRATPTWHAGRIYFAAPDGLVGCLRADDGRPIWSVNVNQSHSGRGTEFGYACSPLVEAGKVILPVGGPAASVVALSALDGSTVWTAGSEPASYCTALPITFRGRRLAIAFLQNVLAAFELESGRPVWQQAYSQGYDEHSAQPLYDEPHLMVMLPFRAGADLYRLDSATGPTAGASAGSLTARRVRHSAEMSNDTASSVLFNRCVYGFDLHEAQANGRRPSRGAFKCLELESGKVRWTTDRVGHATVLVVDGKLFLFNDKGELILARASPERYEELGRVKVFSGETCWTAPALHRGRIYLRSPSRAACLFVGKAASLEPGLAASAPSAAEPLLDEPADLVWLVGKEREYPFDPPGATELARWYVWSLLGSLASAALIAALVYGLAAGVPATWRRRVGCVVFWTAAFALGLVVTPLANRWSEGFVLTWPASIFVAHQVALGSILGSKRPAGAVFPRWVGPFAAICLVLVCVGYYDLCRRLSLAPAWVFLMGFLPSWPLAVPLAHRLLRDRGVWINALWVILTFSLYFWASAGCLWLKNALVR